MAFDVQNVDLDQLAEVAANGGIEALEELAAGKEVKAPAPAATDPEKTDPDPAATEKPDATDPAKADPEKTEPGDKEHANAVSTRDGKGTIPYSVLKNARERATHVEQENEGLRKQVEDLTQRLESKPPATAAEAAAATDKVDAQIDEMQAQVDSLKDDFPEMAKLLTGQMALLKQTRQQLQEVSAKYEAGQQKQEAEAQATVQDTIQAAIDGNAVLATWQSEDGPAWQAAVDMDNLLRAKPEWAERSYAERFAKAVELVQVMHPEFKVETEDKPAAPAPASTELKAKETPSDKRQAPINSLSDLPGGVPPAGSKREQVEALSGAALGNKFQSMTSDQINEYLASLGN